MNIAGCSTTPRSATPARPYSHFFEYIDLHVPQGLDVHVVLDNLSAHKRTSSSWLNLIEEWFRILTGCYAAHVHNVDSFIEAIELWAEHWNDEPKPFVRKEDPR